MGVPEIMFTQDAVEIKPAPKKRGRKKSDYTPYLKEGETTETVSPTALRSRKFDERARTKKDKEYAKLNSDYIPSKSEAKEILGTRIINQHVIDTCYDLGLLAAERHNIPANIFFWTNGLQQTLTSLEQKKEQLLDIKHDEIVDGETIHRGDLYSLWDLSIS